MDSGNRANTTDKVVIPVASLRSSEAEAELRASSFELVGPTYILDSDDRFIDWNPAFEELIATPLRLVRHQICEQFTHSDSTIKQPNDQSASTDSEMPAEVVGDRLEVELPGYGTVAFRRIISQILDDDGAIVAWSAHLIVVDPVQATQLWVRVLHCLQQRAIWSKYATVYDSLLLNFTDYVSLLETVVRCVTGACICVDLGAGTGNSAIALLNDKADRSVCAVDLNEFMLNRLRRKTRAQPQDRLAVYQCDICSLECFADGTFDGATMVNTLYALDDPAACLREVCRILQQDGTLVLTTSHSQTDVDRLFARLREDLIKKGVFNSLEEAFHQAREQHTSLDRMIHRFTTGELRSMVELSGFVVESISSEYVDAVILIRARKL